MKRTTVTIPDELAYAIEREARRRETSASEIVRDALSAYFAASPDRAADLPIIGLFDAGPDLAEGLDDYLARHLPEHVADENSQAHRGC